MMETQDVQPVEKVEGEGEAPEPTEFESYWQRAINLERKRAHCGDCGWSDRDVAVTTYLTPGEQEDARRGSIGLALSEDGTQVILTVVRKEQNGPGSDMEMCVEAILSLPEAEALAMGLLLRWPGRLSSDYAGGMTAQCLQVPAPAL
jgi:hypothetical protein